MVYVLLGVAVVLFLGVVVAPMIFIEAIKKRPKNMLTGILRITCPKILAK